MHDVTGAKFMCEIPLHLMPRELSWSRLCRHWRHHGLSKRQLPVPSLTPEFACAQGRVGVNSIPELELQLNSNSGIGIGIGIGIEIGGIENGIGIENPGIGIGIGIENWN